MKTLSKFMATTAICTLIGGAALAQNLGTSVDTTGTMSAQTQAGEMGVAPEAEATATMQTQAQPELPAQAEPEPLPQAETQTQTGTQTQAATQAQPEVPPQAQPEPLPQADAAPQPAPAPTTGVGTGVAAGETDPISIANRAMERGEPVSVVSADGRVLGEVNTATQDQRGAAQLSINLDRSLETRVQRVTFVGIADVDAEGRLVLPLGEAEFMSRIIAQTDGSAG